MEVVVEEGGGDVADEGGEEDEGDDGVGDVVVAHELGMLVGVPLRMGVVTYIWDKRL